LLQLGSGFMCDEHAAAGIAMGQQGERPPSAHSKHCPRARSSARVESAHAVYIQSFARQRRCTECPQLSLVSSMYMSRSKLLAESTATRSARSSTDITVSRSACSSSLSAPPNELIRRN